MAAERGGPDLVRRPVAALEKRLGETLGLSLKECAPEGVAQRLRHRIQDRALDSLEAYAEYLLYGAGPAAWDDLAETLTANESRVFGEPADFSPLFEMASDLGGPRARGDPGRFRCLSAGCGTGEEAYSLAIALAEVGSRSAAFEFEVIGVDLSARAVANARRGAYPASRAAQIPPELRERYFTEREGEIVASALKPCVRFARINLCEPDALLCLGTFDLVLARGFLSSLTPDGRRTALANLARALAPGGVLLLGPGDTIGASDLGLVPIPWGNRYAYELPDPKSESVRSTATQEPPDPELALIAHRSPLVRAWIRILLEQRGLVVEEAAHGIQALERVAAGRIPSLVLLERALPPRGGPWLLESLERLRIARPKTVVFLSPGEPAAPDSGSAGADLPSLSLPLTRRILDVALQRSAP
jgi:chemotaxis methyl-accepting protein methylase/CheY-like chemotaxis protein